MAGRVTVSFLLLLVVTLLGINGFLLYHLANSDAGTTNTENDNIILNNPKQDIKSTEISGDMYAKDDGRFKIRIAHLFLLHNEVMVKGAARILKRIYKPQHTYVIHMDIKSNMTLERVKKTLLDEVWNGVPPSEDNVVYLATQNVVWAGITMIQAELDLISRAFQTGRWWDQALLWSGRCYPTKTTDQIEEKIFEWKGKNILEMWGRGGFDDKNKDARARTVCVSLADQMLPECIESLWNRRGPGPVGIEKYYHGAQWFFISRDFAYFSLHADVSRNLLTFMANAYVPDEMFFQTLLINSPYKNNVLDTKKYVWRHEKWYGCEGQKLPCLMTTEELDYAVRDTPLIARKFDPLNPTYYEFVDKKLAAIEASRAKIDGENQKGN